MRNVAAEAGQLFVLPLHHLPELFVADFAIHIGVRFCPFRTTRHHGKHATVDEPPVRPPALIQCCARTSDHLAQLLRRVHSPRQLVDVSFVDVTAVVSICT